MSKQIQAYIDKLIKKLGKARLYRMLLGAAIPIFVLAVTYSGVFYVKEQYWWSSAYAIVMTATGAGLVWVWKKARKCK